MSPQNILDSTLPRSPGTMFRSFLEAEKISQAKLGRGLGVTRQYVNAVCQDEEFPSEEKLRGFAKIAKLNAEVLLAETQRYRAWIATSEGANHLQAARKAALQEQFTFRGVRYLAATEIHQALEAGLLHIERGTPDDEEGEHDDDSTPVIGELNTYAVTCHFAGVCHPAATSSAGGVSAAPAVPAGASKVVLKAKSALSVRTQERFKTGDFAALHFNGLVQDLREKGIRSSCDLVHEFGDEAPLILTLDNVFGTDLELQVGLPIASVLVHYNPFNTVNPPHSK